MLSVCSGTDLYCSQPVLILIVPVGDIERQRAVAVTLPPPAEVNGIVNAPDLILPADSKCDGVVLAIADVRKAETPQDRRVERARRTESIDSQRIVSPILACPLTMVDDARRNLLQ